MANGKDWIDTVFGSTQRIWHSLSSCLYLHKINRYSYKQTFYLLQDQLSAVLTAFLIVRNIRDTKAGRFLPNLIKVNWFQLEMLTQKAKYARFLRLFRIYIRHTPPYVSEATFCTMPVHLADCLSRHTVFTARQHSLLC